MKWSEKLGRSLFSQDASGQTVFYPWSIFGKGYIVPSEEKREQLMNFLRQNYMLSFTFFIVIIITGSHLSDSTTFVVGILTVYTVWYYWSIKNLTEDMAIASARLSFTVACRNSAPNFNIAFLVVAELSAIIFMCMAAIMFMSHDGMLLGLAGLVIFGFSAAMSGCMIYFKIKNRSNNSI
jgi:hypothetical protein